MDRVEEGGHDVPDELIYKRYPRVIENLKKAIPICDFVLLVDNSGEARHRVFGMVTPEKGIHLWDSTPNGTINTASEDPNGGAAPRS